MKKNCCKIEAIVSLDERGQILLPKEIREKLKIKAGDKLALMTWEKGEETCCLSLFRADDLTMGIKDFLGPVVNEVFNQ